MMTRMLIGIAAIVLLVAEASAQDVYYDYAPVSWVEPVTRVVPHQRSPNCTSPRGSPMSSEADDASTTADGGGAGAASLAEAMDVYIRSAREEDCAPVAPAKRVVAYRVGYVYAGEEYVRELDRDPGNRIRVRVSLEARP